LKPGSTASPYLCRMSSRVECTLCRRRLREGAVGTCGMRFNLCGALHTAAYGLSTAAESRPMEISQGGAWRGFAPHIIIRGVSASARFPDLLKPPRQRLELLQLGWRASDEG